MATIADEGRVSKALLHYNFRDRDHLLAAAVTTLADRITRREREAMAAETAHSPVDVLWQQVAAELAQGELRALLLLGINAPAAIQSAVAQATHRRREVTERTVALLFSRLRLVPRFSAASLADAFLAFLSGLALSGAQDPRTSFDLFWLAMLGLGE